MGKIIIDVDINMSSDGGADQEHDFAAAGASFVRLPDIFTQIAGKRCQQDIKWGGADHDDQHSPADWELFIQHQIGDLIDAEGNPTPDYRARLIDIAALACAAMQSWDRLHPPGHPAGARVPVPGERRRERLQHGWHAPFRHRRRPCLAGRGYRRGERQRRAGTRQRMAGDEGLIQN